MSAYIEILRRLSKANLDYVLVGGMAVNLHGVPRMTYDMDLFTDLRGEKGWIAIIYQWITERNMKETSGRAQDQSDIEAPRRIQKQKPSLRL